MLMHQAEELMEVDIVAKANEALAKGWTLVAVVPSADGPVYVLGRKSVDSRLSDFDTSQAEKALRK